MPSPQQKVCPQCQTPAPVSAGFCGSCGHRYRTQFANTPSRHQRLPLVIFLLVPLVAFGAFLLVMLLGRKPASTPPDSDKIAPLTPPSAREEPRAEPPPPKLESDPLMREAQRALKHATQDIEDRALNLREEEKRSRRSRSSGRSSDNEPVILEGGR